MTQQQNTWTMTCLQIRPPSTRPPARHLWQSQQSGGLTASKLRCAHPLSNDSLKIRSFSGGTGWPPLQLGISSESPAFKLVDHLTFSSPIRIILPSLPTVNIDSFFPSIPVNSGCDIMLWTTNILNSYKASLNNGILIVPSGQVISASEMLTCCPSEEIYVPMSPLIENILILVPRSQF